jgi:ribose transport system ATP-binding protein
VERADNFLLDVNNLTKRFYGVLALRDAAFNLRQGEIHALVGENGAGKSTFIKILAGVYEKDGGDIRLDGKEVDPRHQALPIGFVHQDLALVDDLSVAENIALTAGYPRWGGFIDWRGVMRQAASIYDIMKVEPIEPDRMVSSLSAPEKAILGIVRTMATKPKVLVLDEPTAALPEVDSLRLFEAMRRLREAGTGVIYVSHRLNELFGLVDRVTVFRDGAWVLTTSIADTDPDRLIEHMLGRSIATAARRPTVSNHKRTVLAVEDLTVERRGPLNFEARAGEILGLVGLRGGGQEAIGRAIYGAIPSDSGRILLEGRPLPAGGGIRQRIAAGVVLLAGDRTGESALAGMTLTENLFVNPLVQKRSAWSPISPVRERAAAQALLETFDVRPRNTESLIDWLSGGNQQKVCIARLLEAKAKVIVLEEPTAGVDIGAKLSIHAILKKAAAEGAALIVVSTDLEEVAALCDRVLIINRGNIASQLAGEDVTVDNLIAHSSRGGAPGVAAGTTASSLF